MATPCEAIALVSIGFVYLAVYFFKQTFLVLLSHLISLLYYIGMSQ